MDYVLQETQRNRQLANHIVGNQIAYRTFAANGVNDGVFTTGPKVCVHLGRDVVNYLVSLIQYGLTRTVFHIDHYMHFLLFGPYCYFSSFDFFSECSRDLGIFLEFEPV